MTTFTPEDLDKLFCLYAKKYGIERHLLKAVAVVESSLNPFAYRFEPAFWDDVLKKRDEWKDRDPKEVSASYGLMQVMYTTAVTLGFTGSGTDLYDPIVNIELGARLLQRLMKELGKGAAHYKCWPVEIVLARYNGGGWGNPNKDGILRNYSYTRKVLEAYWRIREKETVCPDG